MSYSSNIISDRDRVERAVAQLLGIQEDLQPISDNIDQLIDLLENIPVLQNIDQIGVFDDRSDYDSENPGFVYLSIDGDGASIDYAVMFVKLSGTGNWSEPIPFQGPPGDPGVNQFSDIQGDPMDNQALGIKFTDVGNEIDKKSDTLQGTTNRTGSYTVNQNDPNRIDRIVSASNVIVTLTNTPPIGYWRVIRQQGSGNAILSGSTGSITINGATQTTDPNSALLVQKVANNTWDVYGGE